MRGKRSRSTKWTSRRMLKWNQLSIGQRSRCRRRSKNPRLTPQRLAPIALLKTKASKLLTICRHRNSHNPWMKSQPHQKSTTQVTKMKSESRTCLLLKNKKKRKMLVLMIKWLILRCSHSTISWGRYEVQWAQRYDVRAWGSGKLKTKIIANNAYRRIAPSGHTSKTDISFIRAAENRK